MNISDEAVEAAAEAAHLSKLTGVRWGDIPKWKKTDRLSETRAALEAAAPYIAAQAWDEGRWVGMQDPSRIQQAVRLDAPHHAEVPNPYRSQP